MDEIEWAESGWPLLEDGSCDRGCKELALFAYSDGLAGLHASLRKELFPPDGGEWNAKRNRSEEVRRPKAFPGCLVLRFDPGVHKAIGQGLVLSLHESRMEPSGRSFMRSVWFVLPATWAKNADARGIGAACELLLGHRARSRRGSADRMSPLVLDRALGGRLRNPRLAEQGGALRALHDATPSELMMALVQRASDFRLGGSKLGEHLDKGLAAFCLPSTTDMFSLAVSFANATLSSEWAHPIPLASYGEHEAETDEGDGAGSSASRSMIPELARPGTAPRRESGEGAMGGSPGSRTDEEVKPRATSHGATATRSRFDDRRRKGASSSRIIPADSGLSKASRGRETNTAHRSMSSVMLGVLIGLTSLQTVLQTCHMIDNKASEEQPRPASGPGPSKGESTKPGGWGLSRIWGSLGTNEGSSSRVIALEDELRLPLFVQTEEDGLGARLSVRDEELVERAIFDAEAVMAVFFVEDANPCGRNGKELQEGRRRVAELLPGVEFEDVLPMERAYGLSRGILITSAEEAEGWWALQLSPCEEDLEMPMKSERWGESK